MNLIDKDILVSWIENRMLPTVRTIKYDDWECGENKERINILNFIKELEVKEVDLEKEIDNYISNNFFGSQTIGFFANRTKEEPNDQDIALCAKHFFELGLRFQTETNITFKYNIGESFREYKAQKRE